MKTEKTALVSLPDSLAEKIPGFTNLNGWWNPPEYVLCFWTTGASIPYIDEADYEIKKAEILASYKNAVRTFILLCEFIQRISLLKGNTKRMLQMILQDSNFKVAGSLPG